MDVMNMAIVHCRQEAKLNAVCHLRTRAKQWPWFQKSIKVSGSPWKYWKKRSKPWHSLGFYQVWSMQNHGNTHTCIYIYINVYMYLISIHFKGNPSRNTIGDSPLLIPFFPDCRFKNAAAKISDRSGIYAHMFARKIHEAEMRIMLV